MNECMPDVVSELGVSLCKVSKGARELTLDLSVSLSPLDSILGPAIEEAPIVYGKRSKPSQEGFSLRDTPNKKWA